MEEKEKTLYKFLEVKESGLHGKGLFTSVDIKEDEIIMVIKGEVIDEDECVRREDEEENVYIFWNGDNYIDTANTEKIRFINHSFEPNCYVDERDESTLYLVAGENLKAGDELTIDYDYEETSEFSNPGGKSAAK